MVAPLDLEKIEAVAKIMKEYELDEYASDYFCLKKSKHHPKVIAVSTEDPLRKHLEPSPDEPWMSVNQAEVDAWAEKKQT